MSLSDDVLAHVVQRLWWRLGTVEPGLDDDEIERVVAAVGAPLPRQFELFLRSGLPVGERWWNWPADPAGVVAGSRQWLRRTLAFGVVHRDYWQPSFGDRPSCIDTAVEQAWSVIETLPPLLPLYAHRCVVADGIEPSPVLSVWQFDDTIPYGTDLIDWIGREFDIRPDTYDAPAMRDIAGWSAAFDLNFDADAL
ncbi:MAG: hypothetical protein GEU97_24665 [Actinophytocola sp.]|nr:hypothetical protein [Actinophytocola sp.]